MRKITRDKIEAVIIDIITGKKTAIISRETGIGNISNVLYFSKLTREEIIKRFKSGESIKSIVDKADDNYAARLKLMQDTKAITKKAAKAVPANDLSEVWGAIANVQNKIDALISRLGIEIKQSA